MKLAPWLICVSFVLVCLPPHSAHAEHFNCNLTLNVIEDANSSERKQLIFDVEINQDRKTVTNGVMITASCFGNITDAFNSSTGKFKKVTIGDLTRGTYRDESLTIGTYHYRLHLKFAQLTKSPDETKSIDFIAYGKILPLDNDVFIHQNIKGECHLTKERNFFMNFITMPDEGCEETL